ncbi:MULTISPECIES: bifunctional glycosyltransferase/CDP-glycerol:glycerophosphate glycerophosphotransferase [Staphylococcus]|uniref:bifunctional glycosyltransferase/CDP-glycerol:glycerophosphate glycerophosphotransferase n=1 Tax=Staphylococcus TaxID=1279 RepID=UPI0008A66404|nr:MULTISPECIES: CDP-glycerol glycerophosphotransferase family protein [Staphylococcus]OFQ86987.1 hypothetical protein HMPREF2913_03900 [Staphylococcus sp. HMSC065A08]OIS29672.1 hypothetical protein RES8_09965 [Staphylococcus cohnii]OIS29962.1 hypothetical protein RES9_05445 [Staphylococcus cohnii]OIS33957.1 hypothetical protein RES10_01075 [Staphylococcus cohnii]
MGDKFNVSIIIPVYNAEKHIKDTLHSIENQSFQKEIEVLVINDGSDDNSIEEIEKFMINSYRDNIHYTLFDDGLNLGQGARRNFGIERAQGETIIFLDSDDFLVENAIEIAYTRFKGNSENDIVIFEWAYFYPETNETIYVNKEKYSQKLALYRETCELLLACNTYFTVNKLYRRQFLIDHNIRFGEGYIYEDLEFYIKCALRALRAPVIPNILYKVRVHEESTTKTDYDSLKHRDSFLTAIEKSSEILQNGARNVNSVYQVNKYFIYRALLYSEKRLPNSKKIKDDFIYNTMKIINEYNPNIHIPNGIIPLYHHLFNNNLIKNYEVKKAKKVFKLHKESNINFYSHRLNRKIERKKKIKRKLENNYYFEPIIYTLRKKVHKMRHNKSQKEQNRLYSKKINGDTILMLGFDYKYQGNSKYLFNYLKDKYNPTKLKFVTSDKRIPEDYRIEPRSKEFFNAFYTSKVIIAESWIPLAFKKKEGQVWLQLWHGTPFKKMLFDSNESHMLRLNPNHRIRMKKDIARWDYLLSDSELAKSIFNTSFDFNYNKILNYGYPRNEWLINNSNNNTLINDIKTMNNIPLNKKVILYAPTWRDYNYKKHESQKDKNYMVNLSALLQTLGEDYVLINKAHSMDSQPSWNTGSHQILTVSNIMDSQELLLISDIVVTDYSSIFFDAIHIAKPFYLITKDLNKFNLSRGFYNKIYKDLKLVSAKNDNELANKIKNDIFSKLEIPKCYRNNSISKSNKKINEFILQNLENSKGI